MKVLKHGMHFLPW